MLARSHPNVLAALTTLAALVCIGCSDDDSPRVDSGTAEHDAALDAGEALDAIAPDARAETDAGSDASTPADAGFTGPTRLSETGLYADIATRTLAPGVLPYEVRFELWADGADKERYLLLPDGAQIDTSDMDHWRFPIGTRAWKHFIVDGVLVETRLLYKIDDTPEGWMRIAYVWNDGETDAIARPDGEADARGTGHDVPSSTDCWTCHRGARDTLIGVSALQLSLPSGLLVQLVDAGRLTDPPATPPAIPGPTTVQQALGYLHANCGHCHNDDYPLSVFRALRLWLPVGLTRPEDAPAYTTAIGAGASHVIGGTDTVIVAGAPEQSQLYVRMLLRDDDAMPPLATARVDTDGSASVRDWIASLGTP